jgi:hypothetical protein
MDVQEYNTTKAAADFSNPTGVWANAPSLAASTVEMVNTSGYTVFVDISGGTVTHIFVGGVDTGFTAGTIKLAPGQDFSITYSAAPTVGWTFEQPETALAAGLWSGYPLLASSTVPMVNNSACPVSVSVTGGTVTVIKIDGVTTNLTSGLFRLRRGSSIAITYSVAPTLVWYYS